MLARRIARQREELLAVHLDGMAALLVAIHLANRPVRRRKG
jgi:hypothetical protein